MPKARNPNRDKAFELYKKFDGRIDLVEIASQLNISDGTVRGWKSKDKWEERLNGTFQTENTERSKRIEEKKRAKKSTIEEEVKSVMENTDLTEKQRLFCIYYVKYRNKVKAYQKAFECSYENACSHASGLWKNGEIQKEVNRLLNEYREEVDLDIKDLFQWYMNIARADINDFVKVNNLGISVKKEIDGTLVSEISETQTGIKVKLNDRMKAMDWLSQHIGLADEKMRAEIALLRAKSQDDNGEEIADDGFLEALNGSAREDWSDEED